MKKNVELVVVMTILLTIFTGGCGSNPSVSPARQGTVWEGNGHSYEVFNTNMSWTEARRFAEQRGGYLVTITSSDEQAFIESLLSRNGTVFAYWLGGFRGNDGNFRWVTGEQFVYTNWAPGEPNNSAGIENYIEFVRNTGQWNDVREDYHRMHISWNTNMGFIIEWD